MNQVRRTLIHGARAHGRVLRRLGAEEVQGALFQQTASRGVARMRITVKTAGTLGSYLPPGSERNRGALEVPDGATPLDVMRQLGLPLQDRYLVSLNERLVTSAERASTTIAENDELVIMPPLRGG